MEELPLGRIAALVPEFAVKDLPLGRTLMMMMMMMMMMMIRMWPKFLIVEKTTDQDLIYSVITLNK